MSCHFPPRTRRKDSLEFLPLVEIHAGVACVSTSVSLYLVAYGKSDR
jgi:hypothetical protein